MRKPTIVTFNGITRTADQWGANLGMTGKAIRMRIFRMGIEKALTTPKLSHQLGAERGSYCKSAGRDMRMPTIEKFAKSYIPVTESGCWLWIHPLNNTGYGRITDNGKRVLAHRFSYEFHKGAIPNGLEIDHLCRVRSCVNPNHLEAVTRRTNTIRGIGPALLRQRNASITHCPRGHEYSGDNLYIYPRGARSCRACRRKGNK